jgi:hypothetical protein
MLLAFPLAAVGQTVYRCQDGKKVTYSDGPCSLGAEKRINTDGGPSPDDVAAARARLQHDLDMLFGSTRRTSDGTTRELTLGARPTPPAGSPICGTCPKSRRS